MSESEAELRELDVLRHKVTEYEAALRSAAPRLAAFKRLEELARSQGTTPEAIASQAAVEVMKREKDALVTLLVGLSKERDQLKGEVAMLLINKTEVTRANDELRIEQDGIKDELRVLAEQLGQMRADSMRLLAERSKLTMQVAALRDEVRALRDARDEMQTAAPTPVADAVDPADAVTEPAPVTAVRPGRTAFETIATDDETEQSEAEAFDAFFHAEVDHDKAREWILG